MIKQLKDYKFFWWFWVCELVYLAERVKKSNRNTNLKKTRETTQWKPNKTKTYIHIYIFNTYIYTPD